MTRLVCSRKIHFCTGHRVYQHESKCNVLHGHNYVAWFDAWGYLDHLGRVIDFSVLKEKIGGWIDENWDHRTILMSGDPLIPILQLDNPSHVQVTCFNPTAENMADHLINVVCPSVLDGTGVIVTKVRLYETENCYAEVSSNDEQDL